MMTSYHKKFYPGNFLEMIVDRDKTPFYVKPIPRRTTMKMFVNHQDVINFFGLVEPQLTTLTNGELRSKLEWGKVSIYPVNKNYLKAGPFRKNWYLFTDPESKPNWWTKEHDNVAWKVWTELVHELYQTIDYGFAKALKVTQPKRKPNAQELDLLDRFEKETEVREGVYKKARLAGFHLDIWNELNQLGIEPTVLMGILCKVLYLDYDFDPFLSLWFQGLLVPRPKPKTVWHL